MLQFGEQRIKTPMLRKIETHIARMFNTLGVGSNVLTMSYGQADFGLEANYFELPREWLALCYCNKLNKETLPLGTPPDVDKDDPKVDDIVSMYGELLGFSGIVTTREGSESLPAVFLNSDRGSSFEACHTLVHEMIHLHSHKSQGFQNADFKEEWTKKGILAALLPQSMPKKDRLENVSSRYYTVLDEGVTELFARIVTRSLSQEKTAPEVPRLSNIPVYEFPLAIACDLARSFGLSTLAKAFFQGDLELHKRLAEKNRKDMATPNSKTDTHSGKYVDDYFTIVGQMDINSDRYVLDKEPPVDRKQNWEGWALQREARITVDRNIGRLDDLNKLGVKIVLPPRLAHSSAATYNDPAIALWNEQVGDVMNLADDSKTTVHPAIVAIGGVAATYTAYQLTRESS
jgi:hypothetical protein